MSSIGVIRTSLKRLLRATPHVKIIAYIEMYNFRFPLRRNNKKKYIAKEIKAVRDADVDGWYAWSANNKYRLLFSLLQAKRL